MLHGVVLAWWRATRSAWPALRLRCCLRVSPPRVPDWTIPSVQNNDVVKSWDAIATACNLNGGYRLSSVRVMSHFGQPTEVGGKTSRAPAHEFSAHASHVSHTHAIDTPPPPPRHSGHLRRHTCGSKALSTLSQARCCDPTSFYCPSTHGRAVFASSSLELNFDPTLPLAVTQARPCVRARGTTTGLTTPATVLGTCGSAAVSAGCVSHSRRSRRYPVIRLVRAASSALCADSVP